MCSVFELAFNVRITSKKIYIRFLAIQSKASKLR
jgi:hypothetical protein